MEAPKTYEEFWPYYVSQHMDATCRNLHFVGTTLVHLAVAAAVITLNPWWLLAAPVAGYGFAWLGHFVFEKNRPATFGHPLWSLRGDFRMYYKMWAGKMNAELERVRKQALAT